MLESWLGILPSTGAGDPLTETPTEPGPGRERLRALIFPREYGAWGMLLIPLVTGGVVGAWHGGRLAPIFLLAAAVLALFWLRTPIEAWIGIGAARAKTKQERRMVASVIVPLTAVAAITLSGLFWQGENRPLIGLGMCAGLAFVAQIILKKMGRRTRVAAEVIGAIALTSTAPAAYYVSVGRFDARAFALWLANWLFAANQIHFVWLRIRGAQISGLSTKLSWGWKFLNGNLLMVSVLTVLDHFGLFPTLAAFAFGPVVFRGVIWFFRKPQPIVVRRLGWTELAQALLFGVLLTSGFCFS